MALYHFSAKVISRANGSSAVAAAAYRSASRLEDDRLGRGHDFSNKTGVIHSEVMAPQGSPARWQDRETLWNEVEACEKRKDAQLAREVEFALPREMDPAEGVKLARDFVQRTFVDQGMVADLNVHWDVGSDGLAKPHAHVMLAMRKAGPDGFGQKAREWNGRALLEAWREAWADHVNTRLADLGLEVRVDHRTLEAQGVALEPQHKIGPAGLRRLDRGEDAERALEHREIARRNGERIIAEPGVALDAITRQQSTFTDHDLARFIHRHTDDADQFTQALSAVRTAPDLVALGQDGQGRDRYSTREMLQTEVRLEHTAGQLADRGGHGVGRAAQDRALAAAADRGLRLGEEQADALRHVVGGGDIALVIGYAGSGKSAMLGVAREAWAAGGYRVQGAALSGVAAESLEAGSSIPSRTIASLEHGWAQGRDQLSSKDVLVIDEAAMIGSRQMDRVLAAVERAGAKVVLVGDAEQLQAIEAGAAFRALGERHGAAEITEIRRQHEVWQREATRALASGRTAAALERYEAAGMVRAHATREAAREALADGWDSGRREQPGQSQIMLAHTRADVAALNQAARARMRASGALGEDRPLMTERGERRFAPGDRIVFLRNERGLGVKNGTLGTLESIEGSSLIVRLDGADRRAVAFDLKDYAQVDHGYASTIHKSQGVTVDRAHLLVTDGLDRHGAYVGMSRHRAALAVHYGMDDFKDRAQLVRTLGRDRSKDTTLDYEQVFAERRGIEPASPIRSEIVLQRPGPTGAKRGTFATFKPHRTAERAAAEGMSRTGPELARGVKDYVRAFADVERMKDQALPILPHQAQALSGAGEALDQVDRDAARDLKVALSRRPALAAGLDRPGGFDAILKAMDHEGRVRVDPALRADRFVADWRSLSARREALKGWAHADARRAVEARMTAMAQGLGRDGELFARLDGRRKDLGLVMSRGPQQDLVRDLTRTIGRGLGLSR